MPIDVREEDRPLHDDVRMLASGLGRVIRRFEGEACFEAVESLRVACRSRRRGEPDAPTLDALLAQVDALPLETASRVARAYTLFFLLINTAEQVHRVRRRRAYKRSIETSPQPGSPQWALSRLRAEGRSANDVRGLLEKLEVRPVMTAHPTEATRRTVLELQSRVADALLERDRGSETEQARLEELIYAEIELLWLTSEVRRDRPSVLDEVSTVIWYLEDRFLDAASRVEESFRRTFEEVFREPIEITFKTPPGSWVGGDRDGNPFVTPEITLSAARRGAHALVGHYLRKVRDLVVRLSLSSRLAAVPEALRDSIDRDREVMPEIWETNRRRDDDEPIRLKLSFIEDRLRALQRELMQRERGRPEMTKNAYRSAADFLSDLHLLRRVLEDAKADRTVTTLIKPLIRQVEALGFTGCYLDIREDSEKHTRALDAISDELGTERLDSTALERELLGRRPLLSSHLPLDDETRKTTAVFDTMRSIQRELGERAASTYIVSMTHSRDDLLRVLLLAREAGLIDLAGEPPQAGVDVVPLFETRKDLVDAPAIMKSLFESRAYARYLAARDNRQEVMLGYSDSAKDAGLFPASWALYQAQERLTELANSHGVELTLFHGRGGTVGRGGGSPVFRALTALPPGTVKRSVKITEQGEVISQKFALPPIAERTLEVMVTGALWAEISDWRRDLAPERVRLFRATMDRLAEIALPVFRHRVHEDESLFSLFTTATPVKELAHVHFGSRPAYRDKGAGRMEGIRAIPWVFGWTQIRLMLPSWLGVGTALDTIAREEGGLDLLQDMAQHWPFFDDLLAKVEMVCAKADLAIARLYVERLGGDVALFEELENEYRLAVRRLLEIRGHDHLLQGVPVLDAAIALRNPYVDPLSLLQVSLLRRKKASPETGGDLLEVALGTTLNGVAQGMRNTG